MEPVNHFDSFRSQVRPALESKLAEFRVLGYDSISESALWDFLVKKKWKKVTEELKLHEVVQDIFSIKVSDYISYATVEAYKADEFSFDNSEDWKELLK